MGESEAEKAAAAGMAALTSFIYGDIEQLYQLAAGAEASRVIIGLAWHGRELLKYYAMVADLPDDLDAALRLYAGDKAGFWLPPADTAGPDTLP